jgi:death-on-curing protein
VIAYLTFETVLEIHDMLIAEYGGAKGLLSEALLRSALEMPKASYGGKALHRTIFDKTAAYLFHIIQNHPFTDGNKRTAAMSAIVFLSANYPSGFGYYEEDYQDLILKVAQGKATKKDIAKFFRSQRK